MIGLSSVKHRARTKDSIGRFRRALVATVLSIFHHEGMYTTCSSPLAQKSSLAKR